MPLLNSFVIWNNKGGVGKTTLTFHMSTEYAIRHPKQKILVIDLCPQANVSMALLALFGTKELTRVPAEKSISSYLHQVTNLKPLSVTNPGDFLIRVRDFNRSIPSNVFLLGGDAVNLELMAPSLEQKRQKEISKESIFCYNPWVYITSCVRYFIEGFENMKGVATDPHSDWVVFIDTNPSFSIFTEMAIVAAQRLIIPTNADDFSREAIKATLSLVYGYTSDEKPGKFSDETVTFSDKAAMFNVRLPKICLIIQNRFTRYNGPAKAYSLMAESISEVVFSVYKSHKHLFEKKGLPEDVEKEYCAVLWDFHTVGVVALHNGRPLEDFACMEITVFDQVVSLKRSQIDKYKECLQKLVTRLCPQTCYCKPAPVKLNCNKQWSLPMRTYPPPCLQVPPPPYPPPQYQANSRMPMGAPPPPPSLWGPSPTPILVPLVHTILFQPTYNNGMGGF
ncbi:unnamed protein product [Porites evermanni]|uniref:AAA domain-containing protein n=1 Tax=Porites evermanni TaxID=104178 RepID=A0ABN8S5W1_9CNID|nr:unnamed protein product [Porites evermanni]